MVGDSWWSFGQSFWWIFIHEFTIDRWPTQNRSASMETEKLREWLFDNRYGFSAVLENEANKSFARWKTGSESRQTCAVTEGQLFRWRLSVGATTNFGAFDVFFLGVSRCFIVMCERERSLSNYIPMRWFKCLIRNLFAIHSVNRSFQASQFACGKTMSSTFRPLSWHCVETANFVCRCLFTLLTLHWIISS